jgi:hydroxyacylglutathione hydrolase
MRRALRIVAWVGAGLALCLVALIAAMMISFAGLKPIADGEEIVPGVRTVKDGHVSVFILDAGPGKVVLIDAGDDPAGKPILSELSRRGLEPNAVAAVFLTHGHRDHVGGCGLFPRASIFALSADVALAEGREGGHGPVTRLFPFRPRGFHVTRALSSGESVAVGELRVTAFAVPGHTVGSAAYLANGVLFLGDSALAGSEGDLKPAPRLFTDDASENRASLHSLAALLTPRRAEVKALAFAHSGSLRGLDPLIAFASR